MRIGYSQTFDDIGMAILRFSALKLVDKQCNVWFNYDKQMFDKRAQEKYTKPHGKESCKYANRNESFTYY